MHSDVRKCQILDCVALFNGYGLPFYEMGQKRKPLLQVEVVRSDRRGEYYERYDETSGNHGPFARFLEQEGILTQYTMLRMPQ